MKFKFAYGRAPGNSSTEQKTEYGDRIKITNGNGVAVISLSDPKGMTDNSGYCAELAAEAATALMEERFDDLYPLEDHSAKKSIWDTISKAFQMQEMEPLGLEGDLLFVAVKAGRYLAGHIGGGLIAKFNGSCSILSKQENNFYENEYAAMEDDTIKNLRIYRGEMRQEPYGFMLMSSGACQSLYDDSTGNLSSACNTFFEWLKEFDEETVSEALADNINKYFLKDTNGDISVALMISDKNDMEQEAVLPETEPPVTAKRHSKNKDLKYFTIALIIVLMIIISKLIQPGVIEPEQEGKTEPNPPAPPITYSEENLEPTVTFSVENPESFAAGEYEVGVDISAGEYFFWTGDMLKPGGVVLNGDTCLSDELYCMTIQVKEGDTLTSEYRFTAAENVNPVKATKGLFISGKYKIGKDIAPGEYTVSPNNKNTKGRYYSIFDEEISNDTEISDETTVDVPEEGYVVLYNSVLVVEQ